MTTLVEWLCFVVAPPVVLVALAVTGQFFRLDRFWYGLSTLAAYLATLAWLVPMALWSPMKTSPLLVGVVALWLVYHCWHDVRALRRERDSRLFEHLTSLWAPGERK